jgi:hypothetical protein
MAGLQTTTPDRPKREGDGAATKTLVSGNKLPVHFGCSRQNVDQLMAQGVIERRADGLFDQDQSRLKYITHLRTERATSPRSATDADFESAKAELIRLRIREKQRELIPLEEATAHMEEIIGMFTSGLAGFAARFGGRDLTVRRAIDKAVYDLRLEIATACAKKADECGEPPLDDGEA